MSKRTPIITAACRKRLQEQGYQNYSDQELSEYKFGIRFAYYLCGSLVILGLSLTSLKILAAAMTIAFLGSLPPYHPFDYLYNYGVRHIIDKPKLPPRSNQGRFACGIATIWLGVVIYLFYSELYVWGYLAGGILVLVAALVSTMDICIPSMVYNALFQKKEAKGN
jgi:hypothetical protein